MESHRAITEYICDSMEKHRWRSAYTISTSNNVRWATSIWSRRGHQELNFHVFPKTVKIKVHLYCSTVWGQVKSFDISDPNVIDEILQWVKEHK